MRLFELLKVLTGDAKIINQYGTELFRIENNKVSISDVVDYGSLFVSEIEIYDGIFKITLMGCEDFVTLRESGIDENGMLKNNSAISNKVTD